MRNIARIIQSFFFLIILATAGIGCDAVTDIQTDQVGDEADRPVFRTATFDDFTSATGMDAGALEDAILESTSTNPVTAGKSAAIVVRYTLVGACDYVDGSSLWSFMATVQNGHEELFEGMFGNRFDENGGLLSTSIEYGFYSHGDFKCAMREFMLANMNTSYASVRMLVASEEAGNEEFSLEFSREYPFGTFPKVSAIAIVSSGNMSKELRVGQLDTELDGEFTFPDSEQSSWFMVNLPDISCGPDENCRVTWGSSQDENGDPVTMFSMCAISATGSCMFPLAEESVKFTLGVEFLESGFPAGYRSTKGCFEPLYYEGTTDQVFISGLPVFGPAACSVELPSAG